MANKNFPVDLKEQTMSYLLDLWINWGVVYYAVVSIDKGVLIRRLDGLFNVPKAPESIADAPHRYTGIKPSRRPNQKLSWKCAKRGRNKQ